LLFILLFQSASYCQVEKKFLSQFTFTSSPESFHDIKTLHYDFQGYTSHWDKFTWNWYGYNGLFLLSQPSPESEIWKLEMDIGNELLLDELWIQKGFVSNLAKKNLPLLNNPSVQQVKDHLINGDLLIVGIDKNPLVEDLLKKLPEPLQFRRNRAFYLKKGTRTLFIISGHTQAEAERLNLQIQQAKNIIEKYNLFKGLAGVHSNYLLITPGYHHNPYTLINKAIQIGCSWVMISGYNDWILPGEVNASLKKIDFPFTFLPGQYGSGGVMYGMDRYPNIQNNTIEECLDWKDKNKGYYFSNLDHANNEHHQRYSGFIVNSPADQVKMDSLAVPFITNAGTIDIEIPPAMILFLDKNEVLNEQNIWQAITGKQSVALFDNGQMLGPETLCDPLKILWLEKEYLEKQFDSRLTIKGHLVDNEVIISIQNRTNEAVSGTIQFQVSPDVIIGKNSEPLSLILPATETRELKFPVHCKPAACGRDIPIGIIFKTGKIQVRTLTHFEVPHAVEIHPLIFDVPGRINYPVTVFNYTNKDPLLRLEIYSQKSNKLIHSTNKTITLNQWQKMISGFEFSLDEGEYNVRVRTLGTVCEGKISIKSPNGLVHVYEDDHNDDGIPEIVMDNSKIKATLLLFGGRVIEYIVKSNNENLLFKLWPKKPPWADEPRGVRAFYPYGGLEEFTGYPYIGGHIVFKHEIIESSGVRGRVRLWANIHGSKIEKIITLFGDSELLEVRYAMNDIVPSITVIGINPLIEIGPSTGPEDIYYFPADNLEQRRPLLERYYGDMFFLNEGWAAGYDTKMDISLVIGYPVNDAMFMHLWNNHPDNTPTPYYYTELQPWLKVKPETTTYFSYYLFGQTGPWKRALENFRQLGLVTKKITK
jgi:hypothetical protein